jgi:hypothetical protein
VPTQGDSNQSAALTGSAERQAVGLFNGVNFQVWQTVLAWIDLAEDETLFVEGAEDFDVVANSSGVTVQTKATERAITLRSKSTIEALRNFWEVFHRNPRKQIRFRFVTTSSITAEEGSPFGGVAGLEIWNTCARTQDVKEVERIRAFLVSDPAVSQRLSAPFRPGIPPLIEFLRSAPSDRILATFVQALSWEVDQGDVEVAKEAVRRRLHAYGERVGLLPSDTDLALPTLFEHVASVGFRNHRALDREDFRLVFEGATKQSVPRQQFASMLAQISGGTCATQTVAFTPGVLAGALESSLPKLPEPCCARSALTNLQAETLIKNQALILFGSTGTGKSTQALLIAKAFGQTWTRVRFPKSLVAQQEYLIRELIRLFDADRQLKNVLFDDIDLTISEVANTVRALAAACLIIRARGGNVIITTHKRLPGLFFREALLPDTVQAEVPRLSETEIEELCGLSGCDDPGRSRVWSRLIQLHTAGHPQLVRARVIVLRNKGWPAPSQHEIGEVPEEIREERQLARQLLKDLTAEQREQLYRLTLASNPFRRDHAVAFSDFPEPISQPGGVFDSLVGPWIESLGSGYVRRA